MAINIDTAHPLRRPLELQQLVEAVVAAGSADEALWVECKNNDFSLSNAEGRFKTARAILSFANRMPNTAATVCGGLAYLIIGAEPGKVDGTAVLDGAQIDDGLIKYLGGDGPGWSPTYVKHGAKDVLVIVIEAPKWGDRIRTLRQGYERCQAGTVFYRSGSVSRPANAEEVRLLEDRFARGQQAPQIEGLAVDFVIAPPDDNDYPAETIANWRKNVIAIDITDEMIEDWIASRRSAIHNHHQSVIDAIERPRGTAAFLFTEPSIDEAGIEAHLEKCRPLLADLSRRQLITFGYSLVRMQVTNGQSPRILEDVEMTLTMEVPFSAFEQGRPPKTPKRLPAPPEPPAVSSPINRALPRFGSIAPLSPRLIAGLETPDLYIPNNLIDIEDFSITLTLGQVRPEKTVTSVPFHLFVHDDLQNGELTVHWTLTSTSTEGIQRGSIQVPTFRPNKIFVGTTQGLPDPESAG